MQTIFRVDDKGRPAFPNSRRQLCIGGIVCLMIHPGLLTVFYLVNGTDSSQDIMWLFVNPFSLVTLLGIWLIGTSVFSTEEWPKFKEKKREEK